MQWKYWLLVPVSLVLVSCRGPESSESARADALTSGAYTVCDEGDAEGHGDVVGKHLALGSIVDIRKIDPDFATAVCLKSVCPEGGAPLPDPEGKKLWLIGDARKLTGVFDFGHRNEDAEAVLEPHLVQIFMDPEDHGACTKQNVVTVKFCILKSTGDGWTCKGTEPHFGHVHAES